MFCFHSRYKIGLILFFLSPLSAFALNPMDLSQSNLAIKTIYNAYARALRVLPSTWSCSVQRKLGVYVLGANGAAAYAVASGNTCAPNLTPWPDMGNSAYNTSPYQTTTIYNVDCTAYGYCNSIGWRRGSADGAGRLSCSVSRVFAGMSASPPRTTFSDTCTGSNIRKSCMTGAYGWTAYKYYPTDGPVQIGDYFSTTLLWFDNCGVDVIVANDSYWIPAPTFTTKEETAEIRSAIQTALNTPPQLLGDSTLANNIITNEIKEKVNPVDTQDNALYRQALDYIDNGVVTQSTSVPSLNSQPPVWAGSSYSSSTAVNVSSTIVNVTSSVTVNISLDQTNLILSQIRDDVRNLGSLSSVTVSVVEGSTDVIGTFQNTLVDISSGVSNSPLIGLVNKLQVPESSAPLTACWSADLGAWGGQRQICLSDFTFLTWVLSIVKVLVILSALYVSIKIAMGVGMA